jgi:hypothetical protein
LDGESAAAAQALFRSIDVDGDGSLTAEEIAECGVVGFLPVSSAERWQTLNFGREVLMYYTYI